MLTKALVFIQFTTLLIIVLLSDTSLFSRPASMFVLVLSLIIGLIPILQKNLKVSIFPETTKDMKLITNGIYKFIRHPMYLSVLLVGLAFVIADPKPIMFLVWLILLANLHLKMDIEEINLMKTFDNYKDYRKTTKRLIPFIY